MRCHTGNQLVPVNRPDQVIIHAHINGAVDHRVIDRFGQHQHRQVAQRIVGADLRNQAQRVGVTQAQADNRKVISAFLQALRHMTGMRLDIDDMVQLQRRAHPIRGIGAIFNQQDASILAILGGSQRKRIREPQSLGASSAGPQFIRQVLQPHERAHTGQQREFVDRLRQEIIGAGLQPGKAVRRTIQCRHHDDREMRGLRGRFQPAANLIPVHARHHDIEQHHIAFATLADIERLGPGHGGDHGEVFRSQPRFQQTDVRKNIVNDQHARGHSIPQPTR